MASSYPRPATVPGKPLPLGATPVPGGTRFSVFSRHADSVTLLLFDHPEAASASTEIPLDPGRNRTGDVWHLEVEGVGPGAVYLYRVDGPWQPEKGHLFNPARLLLDPYVKAVAGGSRWDLAAARTFDPRTPGQRPRESNNAGPPKGVVVADDFDWRGDRSPGRALRHSVIYETHVRGLTRHESSGVDHPGTFRGLIEKIPYLADLGITAIELMPVQEFDAGEIRRAAGRSLANYWGYNTIAFFAPRGLYSSGGSLGEQVTEFKEMVRALHAAGIEVILDMVFNHTAEGDETGPTLCMRGWDNSIYYMLDAEDPRRWRNYTGTGNTVNCNHPVVRSFIMDCLRYWVQEMHVDGFRFDLASVFCRDPDGRLREDQPLPECIAEDPVLRGTKIIAEAWDAAGAYQVGRFPGKRWAEWNDRFRDDVRRFWRGDPGAVPNLATRLAGSSDLYRESGRTPSHSINFITSHDGFTLNDVVSYGRKHNEENGEANADGATPDVASNNGHEGPTDDPAIERVRERQARNMLATLLLSLGTPMLLGGDEMRRTQRGNNNPWCQDNEVSWYDWRLLEKHADLHRFCRGLVALRRAHPAFLRPEFYGREPGGGDADPDVRWMTETGQAADWSPARRALMLFINGRSPGLAGDGYDNDIAFLLNAAEGAVEFTLPARQPGGTVWHRVVDTARLPPRDIMLPGSEERVGERSVFLVGRSLAVFLAR